jgi:hypothetical protein
MDTITQSLRKLHSLLVPGITAQDDKEIRAEIEILKIELKKLEEKDNDKRLGISSYGSYFSQ